MARSEYSHGKVGRDALLDTAVRLGFINVLDAFLTVKQSSLPVRFFEKAGPGWAQGLVLTDNAQRSRETNGNSDLTLEAEPR